MFQKPREAKRLFFDVIPRAVDDYQQFLGGFEKQDWKNRLGNPVWHVHGGSRLSRRWRAGPAARARTSRARK